ncbi:DeoR family transcriptional regulator [Aeromonas hydrophila]|uniref:DeoR family transcriptional regulator n=1 Tax=Aeromonas hydrophila TaxID=644 RepID=UPI00235EFF0D|nr:DeoR family transcriptional regulator [Aeromonas hydrophila]WDA23734.1 DeoR family transcriptional regulator [Aeromonas hydrophila]
MQITEKSVLGTSERRERIIQQLRSNGSVQVNELAGHYQVSTVTIRNDLAFLEKQGVAVRAYGGALLCESGQPVAERTIADKSVLNTPVKQRIGAMAASLVQPGCRLILDSGTTTLEVARHLRDHQEIVVMTNGMNVANALLEAEGVELLMTGGAFASQVTLLLRRPGGSLLAELSLRSAVSRGGWHRSGARRQHPS